MYLISPVKRSAGNIGEACGFIGEARNGRSASECPLPGNILKPGARVFAIYRNAAGVGVGRKGRLIQPIPIPSRMIQQQLPAGVPRQGCEA